MFWHLSIFRRHSQRDPALIACGKEQVHTGKCVVKTNTFKKEGKDLEINEGEWTGKAEIKTWKKFLAVGKKKNLLIIIIRNYILT